LKVTIESVECGQIIPKCLSGSAFVPEPAPGDGFLLGMEGHPKLFVLASDLSALIHGEIEAPVELDPWRTENDEASPEQVSPDGGGNAG
jgi:hypothetical protein